MITGLFTPSAQYHQPWSGALAIISPSHTPSVDFYITSRFNDVDAKSVFCFDSLDIHAEASRLPVGTFVVIVRHTSTAWIKFIEAHQHRWSGVAYLMDDDLPGTIFCRDIPFDYALWTSGRYWRVRKGLARVCDRLWLSTEPLRARYQSVETHLVSPQYFGQMRPAAPVGTKRWAYHGTRIHQREIKWLLPIVRAVQNAVPDAAFELFGNKAVKRQFSGIPRVNVNAPVPWVDYLNYCESANIAISLAPMLAGRFNAVRSYTKAFDIARCGAVGVFSMCEPYAALQTCSGALVLQNNQAQWAKEIINLLQDDDARLKQYQQFSAWIDSVSTEQNIATIISSSGVGEQ